MKTITIKAEVTFDDEIMYGDNTESQDWFYNEILKGEKGLLLHSNEIGDTVGEIKILEIGE